MADDGPSGGDEATVASNRAVVTRLWAALYDRHDFDEVGSLFAPDGFYCDMPNPAQGATGPAEVAARLRLGLGRLRAHTHDIERMVAEGDTVVTEHVEHWVFPTGETVSLPFVSVHRLERGRVVLWRDYWNWNTLMEGVPPWWLEEIAAGYR
jgi:limonene-1,2-epoxide hydrolase